VQESSVLWLRVATLLYTPGLIVALISLFRPTSRGLRAAMIAFLMGTTLHLVSVVEEWLSVGRFPANNFFETVSLFALLLAVGFLLVNTQFQFQSLAFLVFPLVFVMSLTASLGSQDSTLQVGQYRDAWLITHVVLVLIGLCGLVLTAGGSLFYLAREQQLKNKQLPGDEETVPPLLTLDKFISQAMSIGFVFITLAVVIGIVWASNESGVRWISEEKTIISMVTWLVYLVMVFLRIASGWRGRKAAIMALTVLACTAVTWATHAGFGSILSQ
jgi:ABC-type uncharacterized transport system permease subunit